MYEELVKRLREATGLKNASEHYSLMKEAAAAIETLIGKVKYLIERCDMADKNCSEATRLGALWKEAALDQKPRWIPVTERLPEKAEQIADHWFSAEVIGKDEVTIRKAYYNFTAGVWLDANCEMEWDSITHWMPMPPKEETE